MNRTPALVLCGIICFMTATGIAGTQAYQGVRKAGRNTTVLHEGKRKLFEKCMDEYISQQMESDSGAGFSIVVVVDKRTVYQKGFGYADKDNGKSVDSSTLFHIGSITKLFTGIGIMQLAQKGLVNIDAPLQQYLPEFSIKYHTSTGRMITLRSIMAHQSGIFGDRTFEWGALEYPQNDFRTFPEFAKNEYAAYHPNYITAYSNFAVSLLGLVIERVSGQKYEDYIYDHILAPCAMTESGFDPKGEHDALLAKGYGADGNPFPYYYYISCNPAGFLASSSDNMAKFMTMIMNNGYYHRNRILFPNFLRRMYHPQDLFLPMNLYDVFTTRYHFGMSWMLGNESTNYLGRVIGHGGNLPPYNSNLLIAIDRNIGVFVTANKADFYPDDISYFALEQAGRIFKGLHKKELPQVPSVTVMPEHLRAFYTGTYCMANGNPMEVFFENDTLYYQELHSERVPLLYHADDWLSLYLNNEIVPGNRFAVRYLAGQKVLCSETRNDFVMQREIIGNCFHPDTLSEEILAYTGTYAETESGEPALFLCADTLQKTGEPFLRLVMLPDSLPMTVQPGKNLTLIIQGMGRGAQETVYITGDTLHYSGFKFIKVPASNLPAQRSLALLKRRNIPTVVPQRNQHDAVEALKVRIRKSRLF